MCLVADSNAIILMVEDVVVAAILVMIILAPVKAELFTSYYEAQLLMDKSYRRKAIGVKPQLPQHFNQQSCLILENSTFPPIPNFKSCTMDDLPNNSLLCDDREKNKIGFPTDFQLLLCLRDHQCSLLSNAQNSLQQLGLNSVTPNTLNVQALTNFFCIKRTDSLDQARTQIVLQNLLSGTSNGSHHL